MEQFNPNTDKIAIVLKEFTLKKRAEILERYSEPYFVSIAIDENGLASPGLHVNTMTYPHVKKGQTVHFDGIGYMIYGPKNPGEFVTYSILFLESDKGIRETGAKIHEIVSSQAAKIGIKALLVANPALSTATEVLQKLVDEVANMLTKNKDDELFRKSGTFVRDVQPPYDINESFPSGNDFINATTQIIPLSKESSLQTETKEVCL